MFTLKQIQDAHDKVTSGADFPGYVQDLASLGVISYEVYVQDGHTIYQGDNNYTITAPAKYEPLEISQLYNDSVFSSDLKAHQQGKTNYMAFCSDAAKSGIYKRIMNIKTMECIYVDLAGNHVLIEVIPH